MIETPKCSNGHEMKNLGNVSGIVMTSNPPQWTEVWVCDACREKKMITVSGLAQPDFCYLDNYKTL